MKETDDTQNSEDVFFVFGASNNSDTIAFWCRLQRIDSSHELYHMEVVL